VFEHSINRGEWLWSLTKFVIQIIKNLLDEVEGWGKYLICQRHWQFTKFCAIIIVLSFVHQVSFHIKITLWQPREVICHFSLENVVGSRPMKRPRKCIKSYSLFWPWPWLCTKHNGCLFLSEQLNNRDVLVVQVIVCEHEIKVYPKLLWPSNINLTLASLCSPFKFVTLHNHLTSVFIRFIYTITINWKLHVSAKWIFPPYYESKHFCLVNLWFS